MQARASIPFLGRRTQELSPPRRAFDVGFREGAPERFGGLDEHLIAGYVAVLIVDGLMLSRLCGWHGRQANVARWPRGGW